MIFLDYRIRTPPKHHFFMVLMQFKLRNLDNTNTNSEHVCNMNSHFKDNINLPSLSYLRFYDQDSLRRGFLRDSALKIQNSIV